MEDWQRVCRNLVFMSTRMIIAGMGILGLATHLRAALHGAMARTQSFRIF